MTDTSVNSGEPAVKTPDEIVAQAFTIMRKRIDECKRAMGCTSFDGLAAKLSSVCAERSYPEKFGENVLRRYGGGTDTPSLPGEERLKVLRLLIPAITDEEAAVITQGSQIRLAKRGGYHRSQPKKSVPRTTLKKPIASAHADLSFEQKVDVLWKAYLKTQPRNGQVPTEKQLPAEESVPRQRLQKLSRHGLSDGLALLAQVQEILTKDAFAWIEADSISAADVAALQADAERLISALTRFFNLFAQCPDSIRQGFCSKRLAEHMDELWLAVGTCSSALPMQTAELMDMQRTAFKRERP